MVKDSSRLHCDFTRVAYIDTIVRKNLKPRAGTEPVMEIYNIRIVKDGQEIASEAFKQASDYAAIRHARNLAEQSDHVEVWRGNHCLFTGSPIARSA
jgi:hypothetical protein